METAESQIRSETPMTDAEFVRACWLDTEAILTSPDVELDRKLRSLMMFVATGSILESEMTMMSTIVDWAMAWRHSATPDQQTEMSAVLAEAMAFASRMEQRTQR